MEGELNFLNPQDFENGLSFYPVIQHRKKASRYKSNNSTIVIIIQ